ncbi:MAG: ABC transporter substrate-binding protein [Bacteroidales bacterium]
MRKKSRMTGLLRWLIGLLVLHMAGCRWQAEKPSSHILSERPGNDYARGFEIVREAACTRLNVYNPWQGAREQVFSYCLVPEGMPVPAKIQAAEKVIRTPVKKVVCFSTTQVAMIEFLGQGDAIAGVSGVNFIYSPRLRERVKRGLIRETGYDQAISWETLLELQPDIVLAYGVTGEVNRNIRRMEELGIPVVFTAAYLEPHPLGKAEWLKFIAAFFGEEGKAQTLFGETEQQYLELARQAASVKERPGVLLGLPWKDTWYISGGRSYVATLIQDAGGAYLWSELDSHESLPYSLESVYHRCLLADVWLNPGAARSRDDMYATDARLAEIKAFRNGAIYNNDARMSRGGGNDYWESGTVYPQRILADLIRILHPGLLPPDSMFYYRKLP